MLRFNSLNQSFLVNFSELQKNSKLKDKLTAGLVVDSNIIFAASYELDLFHEEVAVMLDTLSELNAPLYTNVNIRSEFLELHRRVLIAESLIDLYEDLGTDMSPELQHQFKSHRTNYRKAIEEDRLFKLSDRKIKSFRMQLSQFRIGNKDAWELFCQNYFSRRLSGIWKTAEDTLNLHFLSLRGKDDHPKMADNISWEKMEELVSQYGIGVSDAMILNIFLGSTFPAIITTDSDIAYCIEKIQPANKFAIVPDALEL